MSLGLKDSFVSFKGTQTSQTSIPHRIAWFDTQKPQPYKQTRPTFHMKERNDQEKVIAPGRDLSPAAERAMPLQQKAPHPRTE